MAVWFFLSVTELLSAPSQLWEQRAASVLIGVWLELYWELWGEGWCLSITSPTLHTHTPCCGPLCLLLGLSTWEREGGKGGWSAEVRYRQTFSQECWELSEVTCNHIHCQISHFISALLLTVPSVYWCLLSEPESLAGSQSSCLKPTLIRTYGWINICKTSCGCLHLKALETFRSTRRCCQCSH